MDHKKQVEDYLKHDRTLLGGRNLYNKLPGKNLALLNRMARFTTTPANVEKLCYELCKSVGMTDRQRIILTQKPVISVEAIEVDAEIIVKEALTPDDALLGFDPKTANYADAKKLATALELDLPSKKKADVFKALSEARTELVKKK